jgi:uncharacterized protein
MNVAIVCSAILAAVIFVLGANVSRLRLRRERAGGAQYATDAGDGLFKAVRAHGNAAEYVPTLAVLMLLVGARDPAPWALGAMIGATASRLLHVYGILASPTLDRQTAARFVGAVGTYLFGLVLVAAALTTLR